ncbi:alpha/beta hydrolase [Nissabacter sp. SGAir0207]|uniref:RBBP9/YdeN family alpha/beta hydrolase n=1 Tax=Nissabacter sp. SGAir0207 TaxID=2126321 RepID=UPI0010CD1CA8|nr:alpha/beta hydrolase [Nissabacter sp. SGAir0207]QCR38260.1 hypothetical protein C1N62_19135 [Nissabacter sp. SGAir0207]
MARLFIVHGYTAGPESHWFGWLKQQAEALGMQVCVPAMPDTQAPQEQAWLSALAECVGQVDADTWFVGHSLGCVTVLRYLNDQPAGQDAAGVLMVSGFSEPLATLPKLDAFTERPLDCARLIAKVPHRAVVLSLDDEIVPPAASLRLSQRLEAPLYGLPAGGHFLDRQGFRELPLLATLLREWQAA